MPNAIFQRTGTPVTFRATGGTVVLTANTLANGAGRISARHDLGVTPRPARYLWRLLVSGATAPAVGAAVRLYAATSDGTNADGAFGTVDAAVAAEDLFLNTTPVGAAVCDEALATKSHIASGIIELADRHVSLGVWNALGVALDVCEITLTPLYDEVQ